MVNGVSGPAGKHVQSAVGEEPNGENAHVMVEPMVEKTVLGIGKSKTTATSKNVQVKC